MYAPAGCLICRLKNLYVNLARSRTIKFTQIDALPCSQNESSIFNQDMAAIAHHGRFNMGIAVSLDVAETGRILRHQSFERQQHIVHDIRVGIFVDCNPGRRVRNINDDRTLSNPCLMYMGLYLIRDFHEFVAFFSRDLKCNHRYHFLSITKSH